MLPGGVIAILVLNCEVPDLFKHPILSGDPAKMLPFVLMVTVGMAFSLFGELLFSTSLGKALLGVKVMTTTGQKPSVWQTLSRNVLKLMVLFIPPLGVLMMRSHQLRGLPEIKSGTLVVRKQDPESET